MDGFTSDSQQALGFIQEEHQNLYNANYKLMVEVDTWKLKIGDWEKKECTWELQTNRQSLAWQRKKEELNQQFVHKKANLAHNYNTLSRNFEALQTRLQTSESVFFIFSLLFTLLMRIIQGNYRADL